MMKRSSNMNINDNEIKMIQFKLYDVVFEGHANLSLLIIMNKILKNYYYTDTQCSNVKQNSGPSHGPGVAVWLGPSSFPTCDNDLTIIMLQNHRFCLSFYRLRSRFRVSL